ncbi:DUF6948 domain-containing protein [Paracoccus sp. (in: a-proteobacteria)]|uniref:DUF6948 domain-containing protein n=1 Tax=Paracoccus sp. TaxID=267 RepID=UPI003A85371A
MPDTQAKPDPGIADHLIGKYVIIRATAAGVHAGTLAACNGGQTVRLTNSRRLWRWTAARGYTLSGVAKYGLKSNNGWTMIPDVVDDLIITDACEIITTSPKAQASIEEWPVHEP